MPTVWRGDYYVPGWRIGIDTGVTTDFSLITNSTCNVDINWGDGNVDTGVALSGQTTTTHNYSTPGTYTVEIDLNSGVFRPYYNLNAAGNELITLGDTPAGWSFGATLQTAFKGSANLATVGDIDTSVVTSFYQAWHSCSSLTVFPLLDISSGTTFFRAWFACSQLETFPATFFDSWTGTPATDCFTGAWSLCSSLTATSVENILDSIAASAGQQNAPSASPAANENDITIDYDDNGGLGPFPYGASLVGGVLDPVPASITTLKNRSPAWNIVLNGVAQ